MLRQISDLCAQDAECSHHTDNLAQATYDVNHNMPDRWLIFPIHPGSIRSGAHFIFFSTANISMAFDIYMAAGGFGANNACAPNQQPEARSGLYLYTAYPTYGQPGQGGVKAVSLQEFAAGCKTDIQWVTTETLSSEACQGLVLAACNEIESAIPGLTEQARRSCIVEQPKLSLPS